MSGKTAEVVKTYGLDAQGITRKAPTHWNLAAPALYEHAVRRDEGLIAHLGPFVVNTGAFTGRSPNDKFTVDEPGSRGHIWWGEFNHPITEASFDRVWSRLRDYLADKELFVQDCYGGADPRFRLPVRVVTQYAWHSLFIRDMLIREFDEVVLRDFRPEFTIIDAPEFEADPMTEGTRTGTFILINLARKLVLIGGTRYAGEMKKSVFSILNYLLPLRKVLGMHCSANYGRNRDDVALFFGLSGTGKTTLSTSPDRTLIGDDEHGWSDDGVFNFEGGCYAKAIRVREETEPEIYETTRRFGTILENVVIDPETRRLDLDSAALTENTRAAYPITHVPNADAGGVAGHPRHIFFLTYDAFGVLPPIARLTPDQAMFHYLAGYTSKVAGTERGVTEPQLVFSPCFGGPFLPLHPRAYAELLGEKIERHHVRCWLVNTGITGGPYGVGRRIAMPITRSLINAALDGKLDDLPTEVDPAFHISRLTTCPGLEADMLDPRASWADSDAYDRKAAELAARFEVNHDKFERA
ncbi:phosphoenolpyruvate carboxykinase (ATP) [Paludisphaera mucosa]|uniref:Phosphoenolpyruvate carboxykinase (ATP) n=1 Tax=Paludisphaera mucosa TaxID=3030827 RepID=A0ABT6F805_9BACT|nr:phosphoenolpyruvate carboxykinase (ATP) [Paludisphaera mucosa]MDG3003714.1 phosphoenolpyruvate carboxykinase (ATP) [Paludisphaera mucosa]